MHNSHSNHSSHSSRGGKKPSPWLKVKHFARTHLPHFVYAWHIKVDFHLFRFIFVGIVIVSLFTLLILLMSSMNSMSRTQSTRANEEGPSLNITGDANDGWTVALSGVTDSKRVLGYVLQFDQPIGDRDANSNNRFEFHDQSSLFQVDLTNISGESDSRSILAKANQGPGPGNRWESPETNEPESIIFEQPHVLVRMKPKEGSNIQSLAVQSGRLYYFVRDSNEEYGFRIEKENISISGGGETEPTQPPAEPTATPQPEGGSGEFRATCSEGQEGRTLVRLTWPSYGEGADVRVQFTEGGAPVSDEDWNCTAPGEAQYFHVPSQAYVCLDRLTYTELTFETNYPTFNWWVDAQEGGEDGRSQKFWEAKDCSDIGGGTGPTQPPGEPTVTPAPRGGGGDIAVACEPVGENYRFNLTWPVYTQAEGHDLRVQFTQEGTPITNEEWSCSPAGEYSQNEESPYICINGLQSNQYSFVSRYSTFNWWVDAVSDIEEGRKTQFQETASCSPDEGPSDGGAVSASCTMPVSVPDSHQWMLMCKDNYSCSTNADCVEKFGVDEAWCYGASEFDDEVSRCLTYVGPGNGGGTDIDDQRSGPVTAGNCPAVPEEIDGSEYWVVQCTNDGFRCSSDNQSRSCNDKFGDPDGSYWCWGFSDDIPRCMKYDEENKLNGGSRIVNACQDSAPLTGRTCNFTSRTVFEWSSTIQGAEGEPSLVESITRGNNYYNYNKTTQIYSCGSYQWDSNGTKLNAVERYRDGPCEGSDSCDFDTRSLYADAGKVMREVITNNGKLWEYRITGGIVVEKDGVRLESIPHYASGPCANTGDKCNFASHTMYMDVRDNQYYEIITTPDGRVWKYNVTDQGNPVLQSGGDSLATFQNGRFAEVNGPCHNEDACTFDTHTIFESFPDSSGRTKMMEEVTVKDLFWKYENGALVEGPVSLTEFRWYGDGACQ